MKVYASAKRLLYTFDPGLQFCYLFSRSTLCMICTFLGPYLLGPSLGLTVPLAIGSAGGMMAVTQRIAEGNTRRTICFQTLFAMIGLLTGGGIMWLIHQLFFLQILFVTIVICLNFKWKSLNKSYGQVAVQAMMGSSIMCLIVQRFLTNINQFILIYFFMAFTILSFMCLLMITMVRYPSMVLIDAKLSLCYAHEYTAVQAAKTLIRPTPRRLKALDRAILQNHRCAVATEAAMVGMVRLPATIGEEIHRSAFDLDLLFMRLARIIKHLVRYDCAQTTRLHYQLALIMQLLTGRSPDALTQVKEQSERLRSELSDYEAQFSESDYLLLCRIPNIIDALLDEIALGRSAHAQADLWIRNHAQQLRKAQRAQDNAWFLHPFLKLSGLFGARVTDRIDQLRAPRLHSRDAWQAHRDKRIKEIVSKLESTDQEGFETGFTYQELRYCGEAAAATKTAGTLKIGPFKLTLSDRHVIQAFIAVILASTIGWFTSGQHFFWAALGAFSVLIGTTTTSSRIRKTFYRVFGTALGAGLGCLAIWIIGAAHPVFNLFLAAISAAFAFSIVKRNYTVFSVFLTATIMQVYLLAAAPLFSYALGRIVDNAIGAIVAGLVASFVFPLHTSDVVRTLLATLEKAIVTDLQNARKILNCTDPTELSEIHPLIDARNVENAAADLTAFAGKVLGSRFATSNSWVRRIASRIPTLVNSVNDFAKDTEAIRVAYLTVKPKSTSPSIIASGPDLSKELSHLIDLLLEDVKQLSVVARPTDSDSLIGQPGQFVYEAQTILSRLEKHYPRTEQIQIRRFQRMINTLVRVDESVRNLTRKAWGS